MSPADLHSLLLLPAPPLPTTRPALSTAYLPAITAALQALRDLHLETSTLLEIVVQLPLRQGRLEYAGPRVFDECQKLVAALYTLTSIVCAEESIEVDGPGAVDTRVVLVSSENAHKVPLHGELGNISVIPGPITDISTFAMSRRKWRYVFAVDGEEGQSCLARYKHVIGLTRSPLEGEVRTLRGGLSLLVQPPAQIDAEASSPTTYTTVAVGGTFDHLHAGHKLLLTATALLLQPRSRTMMETPMRRLVVGITGDELLKNKKYAEYLGGWDERQADVVDFLKTILYFPNHKQKDDVETIRIDEPGPNGHAVQTVLVSHNLTIECVEIQDPFGPTITDETISALVVSGETRSGGQAVNSKREEKGMKPLDVFEVDVLTANEGEASAPNPGQETETAEFASKISSTAIRRHKAELAKTAIS